MSISFSDETKEKLLSYKPPIRVVAQIVKNFDGIPTVIDVTSRVQAFGPYVNASTLLGTDWHVPSMVPTLINTEGYFDRDYAGSIWNQAPVKAPEECVFWVTCYMVLDSGATETLWKYIGHVQDLSFKGTKDFSICEMTTIFEQGAPNKLGRLFTHRDGPYSHYYSSTEWREFPYVGSIMLDAPNIITDLGFSTGSPYGYYEKEMTTLHNTFLHLWEKRSSSPVEQFTLETMVPGNDKMFLDASQHVQCRYIGGTEAGVGMDPYSWDEWYYNPIAYQDKYPSEILYDFLDKVLALSTTLWYPVSFSVWNTNFASITPPFSLQYALINQTGLQFILDVLAHCPFTFLFNNWENRLQFKGWTKWSDTATPFEISTAKKNFSKVQAIRNNEDRLATTLVVHYDPRIARESYWLNRTWTPYKLREETTALSFKKANKVEMERMGFSCKQTSFEARVAYFTEKYFELFANPIPQCEITCSIDALQVEIGDTVLVDIPQWKIVKKKWLVAQRDIDVDNMEVTLTLLDREFAGI